VGKHYQDTAVVQAATNMPEHHHTQHQVFVHPHFIENAGVDEQLAPCSHLATHNTFRYVYDTLLAKNLPTTFLSSISAGLNQLSVVTVIYKFKTLI